MRFHNRGWTILVAALGLFPLIAGCSDQKANETEDSPKAEAPKSEERVCSHGGIDVVDMSLSPAAAGGSGAGYGTLRNEGDAADTLLAVSSNVCSGVEIHEMSESESGGMMTMRRLKEPVVLKPGGSFALKRGSRHLMLINLKNDLTAGSEADISMTFARAGRIDCRAMVGRAAVAGRASAGEAGRTTFRKYCSTCHKEDGSGVGGIFPPLNADFLADKERAIDAIVNGLDGPITIHGTKYNGIMSPLPALYDDKQAADVINYAVATFGKGAWSVTPQEIEAIRK